MARKHEEVTDWVQTILRQWDPIGVSQWVDDEYDSYAPKIASLLEAHADAVKLGNHLSQIETGAMGLSGNRSRCDDFARLLYEGFSAGSYRRKQS